MRMLFKLATVAGPTIYSVIRNYGPQIKKLIDQNPEIFGRLSDRVGNLATAKRSGKGPQGLQRRIEVLRDQVTFLYASANSLEVAEQAKQWRRELEALEQSVPILEAMTGRQRRQEMKKITARIDALSTDILAATLQDDIEDAEIVDGDNNTPGSN